MEKKRISWKDEEIHEMLNIMQEHNVNRLLDGKQFRNLKVFEMIQHSLQEKNIQKTAIQIRVKWKHLKSEYFKIKRNNNVSGASRIEWSYWNLLDELLSSRPVLLTSSTFGVESQNDEINLGASSSLEDCDSEVSSFLLANEETPRKQNSNKTQQEIHESTPATEGTPLNLINNKTSSRAYSKSMAGFCSEWKKMQEELQTKLLAEHQKILSEELLKNREWEEKFLKEEREKSENFLRELLSDLKPENKNNPFL